jgi:hypothetical protein
MRWSPSRASPTWLALWARVVLPRQGEPTAGHGSMHRPLCTASVPYGIIMPQRGLQTQLRHARGAREDPDAQHVRGSGAHRLSHAHRAAACHRCLLGPVSSAVSREGATPPQGLRTCATTAATFHAQAAMSLNALRHVRRGALACSTYRAGPPTAWGDCGTGQRGSREEREWEHRSSG